MKYALAGSAGVKSSGIIYEKRRSQASRPSLFVCAPLWGAFGAEKLFLFGIILAAGTAVAATAGNLNGIQTAITAVGVMHALFNVAFDRIVFHIISFCPIFSFFSIISSLYPLIIPFPRKTIPYIC